LIYLAILIGGILLSYPVGLLVDRWGRRPVALLGVVGEMVGLLLFSLSRSFLALVVTGVLWLAGDALWHPHCLEWAAGLHSHSDHLPSGWLFDPPGGSTLADCAEERNRFRKIGIGS
jgi:MFS family permease